MEKIANSEMFPIKSNNISNYRDGLSVTAKQQTKRNNDVHKQKNKNLKRKTFRE